MRECDDRLGERTVVTLERNIRVSQAAIVGEMSVVGGPNGVWR